MEENFLLRRSYLPYCLFQVRYAVNIELLSEVTGGDLVPEGRVVDPFCKSDQDWEPGLPW